MSDAADPLVQIRLSDLLMMRAAAAGAGALPRAQASVPEPSDPPPASKTYLNTKEAAVVLGVSSKCLEAWRAKGEGPPFAHLGRAVRYPTAELRAWVTSKGAEAPLRKVGDRVRSSAA